MIWTVGRHLYFFFKSKKIERAKNKVTLVHTWSKKEKNFSEKKIGNLWKTIIHYLKAEKAQRKTNPFLEILVFLLLHLLERDKRERKRNWMAVREKALATLPTLMRALRKECSAKQQTPNRPLPSLRRAFSLYDQINLIDNVPEDQLRFQGYTTTIHYQHSIQFYSIL